MALKNDKASRCAALTHCDCANPHNSVGLAALTHRANPPTRRHAVRHLHIVIVRIRITAWRWRHLHTVCAPQWLKNDKASRCAALTHCDCANPHNSVGLAALTHRANPPTRRHAVRHLHSVIVRIRITAWRSRTTRPHAARHLHIVIVRIRITAWGWRHLHIVRIRPQGVTLCGTYTL